MNPKRLTMLLAAALGAVAIFVLPGLASADNGHRGGERHNAGTIESFDSANGMLTIDRFGDDNISGLVTDGTRIKCEDQAEHRGEHHHRRGHGRDDNRALRSNSGPGSGEAGDDNGGRGEAEPGDDHGGRGEEEPGDDNGHGVEAGDDNGVGHDHVRCDSSDLTVGAIVRKADRELEGDTIVFDEIELAHNR